MFRSLTSRHRSEEWMDRPDVNPADLARGLRFIRWINAGLGYTRTTLSYLKRFSRSWKAGETIRILDVATGSADVPAAILRWARRAGHDVRIVGVDLHPATCRAAAVEAGRWPQRLSIVRGDALNLPFADGSFDYAMTSMFLHHLDDADAAAVLAEMGRVARRGVIAADLLRTRRAYAWIWLFTLPADRLTRHDARASVRQAFTLAEADALRRAAGLEFAEVRRHFGHRFVMAGERPEVRGQRSEIRDQTLTARTVTFGF